MAFTDGCPVLARTIPEFDVITPAIEATDVKANVSLAISPVFTKPPCELVNPVTSNVPAMLALEVTQSSFGLNLAVDVISVSDAGLKALAYKVLDTLVSPNIYNAPVMLALEVTARVSLLTLFVKTVGPVILDKLVNDSVFPFISLAKLATPAIEAVLVIANVFPSTTSSIKLPMFAVSIDAVEVVAMVSVFTSPVLVNPACVEVKPVMSRVLPILAVEVSAK